MFLSGVDAQTDLSAIILDDSIRHQEITSKFSVHEHRADDVSIYYFKRYQEYLPDTNTNKTNFGFVDKGLWFYAPIINKSNDTRWTFSLRSSQLNDVRIYIFENDTLLFSSTDGISNKTSTYPLPTFIADLKENKEYQLYIYTSSNSLTTRVPIYATNEAISNQIDQFDFLLWGVFYGAILLLAGYAIFYSFGNVSMTNVLFFLHITLVLLWQFQWSGHAVLINEYLSRIISAIHSEELLLLVCITSSIFTLTLIPSSDYPLILRKILKVYLFVVAVMLILFVGGIPSHPVKLAISSAIIVISIGINFWIGTIAYLRGYTPVKPILLGWITCATGCLLSTLYITGMIPSFTFYAQVFQAILCFQACAFLYAIVDKNQYELKLEVTQAKADAENNFFIIEEQNVHLDIARKDAVKASEVKSQFLANMSHEIRTPLNSIVGFSKELEAGNNPAERDEHVKIINSAATDLLTIVNDILDFSKMEAGQLTLNQRPFSPKELFEDIAATMSKTAHLKQLEFLYDVGDLPNLLLGDSFKVKQLLTNLISNALKFTNYGFVGLSVKVLETSDEQAILEMQVKDSGIGISQDDINKIFKAFHQLDDDLNRSYQGTGLGLVICQELAHMMDGKVEVTSTPTVGSKFTITIPFKVEDEAYGSEHLSSFVKKNAVVIDKWGESRRSIVKQLLLAGFDVASFETLKIAVQHVHSNTYVFMTLPQKYINFRAKWLNELSMVNPAAITLLYSGPVPSSQLFGHVNTLPYMLRLPLTARKLEFLEGPSSKTHQSNARPSVINLPPVRMLAVDDMELNLRLIETWLKNSPVTLDLAYDGPSAIQKCEQIEYDIILMDIQMPNMDGIQTSKHIRKTTYNIGTPIVAVTAHALSEEKQNFLNNGLDDFLSKPIKLPELVRIVNQWCEDTHVPKQTLNEEVVEICELSQDSIDWRLAVSRSNNSENLAISFMDEFVEHLKIQLSILEPLKGQESNEQLLANIHKLHGACCYTGVPKLQTYCHDLEVLLKQSPQLSHDDQTSELLMEIQHIVNEWPKRKLRICR